MARVNLTRPGAVTTLIVGLIAPAVLLSGCGRGADRASDPSTPPVLSATVARPSASPTHRAPVAHPALRIPHDAVAAAVPTAFTLTGIGIGAGVDVSASVCAMPYVRPLDPPGDQRHTVCWVRSQFGVAPGSAARGTTYVLGHAWAEAPLVLNPLSIFALDHVDRAHPVVEAGVPTYPVPAVDGFRLTLTTATGRLTYVVRRAFTVAKERAGDVPSVMDQSIPNRVVLITCAVHDGVDVDENVIAYAYLVASSHLAT